jgi:hypothetical protein
VGAAATLKKDGFLLTFNPEWEHADDIRDDESSTWVLVSAMISLKHVRGDSSQLRIQCGNRGVKRSTARKLMVTTWLLLSLDVQPCA